MHTFSLGPSGAGKSYLSEKLAQKDNMLFIEADLWPPQDGMEYHKLKPQWDRFNEHFDPEPLREELDLRAKKASKSGVVLSFPGFPLLGQKHITVSKGDFRVVYFTGTAGQCLDSFLERERITGRGLTISHWAGHAAQFFSYLASGEVTSNAIPTFTTSGVKRSFEEIYRDIHQIA